MTGQDAPAPAAHPWDAVAHLPEGRALIDAHLDGTLHDAFPVGPA